VSQTAREASEAASAMLGSSGELSHQAEDLLASTKRFVNVVRG